MFSKAIWFLKQLFPLTYRSRYTGNGTTRFVVWRSWFGRVFDVDDVAIASTSSLAAIQPDAEMTRLASHGKIGG